MIGLLAQSGLEKKKKKKRHIFQDAWKSDGKLTLCRFSLSFNTLFKGQAVKEIEHFFDDYEEGEDVIMQMKRMPLLVSWL